MLTSTRPVFYTPTFASTHANSYIVYGLMLAPSVWNDNDQIYELQYNTPLFVGKSFFRALDADNAGSQIEVSSILNDNRWQWKREWDDGLQRYLPVFDEIIESSDCGELVPRDENQLDIEPIELSENRLYRSPVSATWMVGTGMGITQSVMSGFPTVEFGMDTRQTDPYTEDQVSLLVYNDYYGILPHVPDIATNNFWFSGQFGITLEPKPLDIPFFIAADSTDGICHRLSIPNNAGNYSFTMPLDKLYTYTRAEVTGYVGVRAGDGGIYKDRFFPLGIVDDCAADFYVSWITPMNTWQSQGFTGRRVIRHSIDHTKMTDMVQRQSIIKTDTGTQFIMNSGIVNEQMYNLLMTIPMSDCIYIYDTKKDEGMFVLCDDTNVTTQRGNRNMQLNFSEIRHNIR